MTRAREAARVLGKVVEVRLLQRRAAEMKVARSNASLRAVKDTQDDVSHGVQGQQAAWEAALAAPRPDLTLLAAWSGAVARGETRLQALATEVSTAEQRKTERTAEWRAALAKAEAAETLGKAALRRASLQQEEAALAEAADRATRGHGER